MPRAAVNLQDVNRSNWLYPDRGMAKWMGWLLSDHSAYLEQEAHFDKPDHPLPAMSAREINVLLKRAWEQSSAVSLQLNELYNNQYLPPIEGVVMGLAAGQVNVMQRNEQIRTVAVADIRHAADLNATKWWRVDADDYAAQTHIHLQPQQRHSQQLAPQDIRVDPKRPLPDSTPDTPFADPTRLPVRDLMCIDCKSFFASVEAVRRAEYPLAAKNAVLSREESAGGLILAASPLCKSNYGVKLGTRKFELRPDMDIQVVAPHMADYIKINYRINSTYRRYTDDEHWYVYSIDESFIDVTGSHNLFGSNQQMATAIQDEVFQTTGIITTIGIGDNPLLAKLALDNEAKRQAPWQATWSYRDVPAKLWSIRPLTDFWSIGARTAAKLQRMNIDSLYDLAHTPRAKLHKRFGVLGDAMYFHAWGIDYSRLTHRYHPREGSRGFGNSQVLMRDYVLKRDCETVLAEISDQVGARLRKHNVVGSVVSISIGFGEPDPDGTRGFGAQTQVDPTSRTNDITRAAWYLFNEHWNGQVLRSVGVRVSHIEHPLSEQISLFEPATKHAEISQLELTIDRIRKRFGFSALVRASSKTDGGTAIARSGLVGGHQA